MNKYKEAAKFYHTLYPRENFYLLSTERQQFYLDALKNLND